MKLTKEEYLRKLHNGITEQQLADIGLECVECPCECASCRGWLIREVKK